MTNFIEFERKFLLKRDMLAAVISRAHVVQELQQGYFMENDSRCVRVRRADREFVLTFKNSTGELGKAIEVEMPMDPEHGKMLLAQCPTGVHKRRHCVQDGEFLWEIDVFLDHNSGLVLAEVELGSDAASDRLTAALPEWVEREVTGQAEYFNTSLARMPAVLGGGA
jgi:adenylate cyclase